jgi:DNA-binding response OmpR family regulator
MEDQISQPPVLNEQARPTRLVPRVGASWVCIVLLTMCCAAVRAADPYAEALDKRFSDLDSAVEQQAREMAKGQQGEPTPDSDNSNLVWETMGLAGCLLALRIGIQILYGRSKPLKPAQRSQPKLTGQSIAGQPSVAALPEEVRTDEGESIPSAAGQSPGSKESDRAAKQVSSFFKYAPTELTDLQTLLQAASRSDDGAARQKVFLQLSERVRYLCYSACPAELRAARQLAVCLEALLQKLASSTSIVTASALRTAASALAVLQDLCTVEGNLSFAAENEARLLVVDDDAVSRFAISAALKKEFNQPELAQDGATALSLAERQTYDAIFLDVEMPGMDGFELCTKIHKTQLNPMTPVVFVTQHSDFQSRAKAAETGGHDLIGKPFVPSEILVKAHTLVLRSRLERRDGNLQSTAKDSAPQPKPIGSAAVRSVMPEMPALCGPGGRGNDKSLAAPGLPSGAALTHREGLVPFHLSRGSAPSRTSDQSSEPRGVVGAGKATPQDYANALYTSAPAHLVQLKERLQAADEAEDSTVRQELLGELYVGVHSLSSEAERAELSAFHRLGSALETLLRKLLERSDSCTASSFEAGAAALSLLDDLCRLKVEPILEEPPVRILVVDDDPIARRALAGAIQVVFDRPKTADGGEAALILANETPFDLILLDVLMPGMDGFTTCAKIRETLHNERTPVVFVTSQSDIESRRQGASAGGCGFIPKPFLAAEITVTVITFALRARLAKSTPSTCLEEAVHG